MIFEDCAKEIIQHHLEHNEFVVDMDGFVYFWPEKASGHFNSAQLSIIADELDRRNSAWQQELDAYFSKHTN